MLGIGLHSYGFMDAAVPWLIAIDLLHLGIIGVGFLPERLWLSSGTDNPIAARAAVR
jgi:hypothetical protein